MSGFTMFEIVFLNIIMLISSIPKEDLALKFDTIFKISFSVTGLRKIVFVILHVRNLLKSLPLKCSIFLASDGPILVNKILKWLEIYVLSGLNHY